jgi:hypothetical protein
MIWSSLETYLFFVGGELFIVKYNMLNNNLSAKSNWNYNTEHTYTTDGVIITMPKF